MGRYGGNVSDGWGAYFTRCSYCGAKYHQSEGGCGCMDDLECQCGKGEWDGDESPRCGSCGTGPHEDGRSHGRDHVARKAHPGGIRAGDKYRRTVHFGYFPEGAFTLKVTRRLIEKGPEWAIEEVMES